MSIAWFPQNESHSMIFGTFLATPGVWLLLLLTFVIYVAFCISAFSEALERPNKESALTASKNWANKNGTWLLRVYINHYKGIIYQ